MPASPDVHYQFASFFRQENLKPYAYLVSKKLSEGHICLHLKEAAAALSTEPLFEATRLIDPLTELIKERLVTSKDGEKQPFVLHNNRLYLQRYFHYETVILERIRAFLQGEQEAYAERAARLQEPQHAAFIRQLFALPPGDATEDKGTDWQLAAALSGVLHNFTIITGGPGTGKTTTVAKILAILFHLNPGLHVGLAAPTGKAAARMAESLKKAKLPVDTPIAAFFQQLQPSTIHRILKSIPGTSRFRHNKENQLPFDVLIVDESSMIDAALFAKLLDAVGPQTRLILLGDKDQLASVEAGSLFGDLCGAQEEGNRFSRERANFINSFLDDKSRMVPDEDGGATGHPLFGHVIQLRHSHRFSGEKGIGRFSKAIIQNDREVLQEFFPPASEEQVEIDPSFSATTFGQFIEGYQEFIREKDIRVALRKLNGLRVLCAMREGEQGLYSVNRRIEDYLHRKKWITRTGEFYVNRPIIVTRNFYNLGLFNGDTGIIRPDENGVLRAWFEDSEGNLKSVLPGYLAGSETVFAMTIHKSQGSEFDSVLVLLPPKTDVAILTRELLYTAVTRARSRVIVQGTEEGILHACEKKVERGSGLAERLLEN